MKHKNTKLFLLLVTIPYLVIVMILVPVVACFKGIMFAWINGSSEAGEAVNILIAEYKKAWAKPKEPERNMWDDEDTWGAQ